MKKLKIGFFADTYLPQRNGVATSVDFLASVLEEDDQKVLIVAPEIKGYKDRKENVLRIPSSKLWPTIPDSVRFPLPFPSSVWGKILSKDYDIIHAHGNGLFSIIGYLVAKQKKIPFILTFHTHFNQYTHYIFKGKVITPKMIDYGIKVFGNLCNGIIAPSEKMKRELRKSGIKKPITVIPNFIDLKRFEVSNNGFLRRRYSIPKNHLILLTVGRLGKEKNFEFIIKIFEKVSKENKNVHLIIVGEGPEKKNLIKLVNKLNLIKQVTLTDGIDIQKMPYVYKDADVFLFASTTESQGMVTLEAAASGLPLVLVKDTAYKSIIREGVNGFALELDEKKFVNKISLLIKNADLRKSFSENSINIVKSSLRKQDLAGKVVSLYESCIKNYKLGKVS